MTSLADIRLAIQQNAFTQAEAYIQYVANTLDSEHTAIGVIKAARALMGWPQALRLAQQMQHDYPNWPKLNNALLAMEMRCGLAGDKFIARAKVLGISGKDLTEKQALSAAYDGQYEQAIGLRENILATYPEDYANLFELMWLHWFQGDTLFAKRLLQQAEQHPQSQQGMPLARLNQAKHWVAYGADTPSKACFETHAYAFQKHPNQTALAARLLAYARHSKGFIAEGNCEEPLQFVSLSSSSKITPVIPAYLHQYWEGDRLPIGASWLMNQSLSIWPEAQHHLMNPRSAKDCLQSVAGASGVAAFEQASYPAFRANLARLAVLWQKGGVWMDIDDRMLVAPLQNTGYLYLEALGTCANNLLIAPPEHPFIGMALQRGIDSVLSGYFQQDGWNAAGVGHITRELARQWIETPENLKGLSVNPERHARQDFVFHLPLDYKKQQGWKAQQYAGGNIAQSL